MPVIKNFTLTTTKDINLNDHDDEIDTRDFHIISVEDNDQL